MTLEDIKIGEKFLSNGNSYLKINFDLSKVSLTTKYDGFVCALDLNTYKIVCFNKSTEITSINE